MTGPDENAAADAADKAAWAGADESEVDEADRAEGAAEAGEADAAPGADPEGQAGDETGEAGSVGGDLPGEAGDDTAAQLAERTDDLKRVSAEFANYRRRVDRDRVAGIAAAKGAVLSELLPLLDDLERAKAHGDLDEGPLKAFSDKLKAVLTAQGAEPYGDEGDAFDPQIHEAVQDESDGNDQTVGTVLRRGYRLGDRILRSAMVVVR